MYKNAEEGLNVIKEVVSKMDFTNNKDLILRLNPEYCPYYSEGKLYSAGSLFNVNKKDKYANEKIKYLVKKDVKSKDISIDNLAYFHPFQDKNGMKHWVKGEFIQVGLVRISPIDEIAYKSTKYMNSSLIDPSLTTEGEWIPSNKNI